MKFQTLKPLLLSLTIAMAQCTPSADENQVTGDQYTPGFAPPSASKSRKKVASIPINVGPRTGSFGLDGGFGFSLANATNFSILLTGCLTGWTTTATAANASLDVYIDDRECLAKLTSYTWDGKVYLPFTDFTTWIADDTAIFKHAASGDTMEVRVIETLDDPVSGSEEIAYIFYELADGGATEIPAEDVGDPHALSVAGQSAPAFSIKKVFYHGTTVTGGGKFTFDLECDEDIAAHACDENALADITYQLVEDTYNDVPTLAEARTVFGISEVAITLPGDEFAPLAHSTVHGGFTTSVLPGPDEMHNHREMILFLRVDGDQDADLTNDSFTYFNVDVEILTYP